MKPPMEPWVSERHRSRLLLPGYHNGVVGLHMHSNLLQPECGRANIRWFWHDNVLKCSNIIWHSSCARPASCLCSCLCPASLAWCMLFKSITAVTLHYISPSATLQPSSSNS